MPVEILAGYDSGKTGCKETGLPVSAKFPDKIHNRDKEGCEDRGDEKTHRDDLRPGCGSCDDTGNRENPGEQGTPVNELPGRKEGHSLKPSVAREVMESLFHKAQIVEGVIAGNDVQDIRIAQVKHRDQAEVKCKQHEKGD